MVLFQELNLFIGELVEKTYMNTLMDYGKSSMNFKILWLKDLWE
jgi:hypothetical protein